MTCAPRRSSTSASTSGRPARTACTSSARCSSRWRWPTAIVVTEAERDEVVCPGVEGENLAAIALAALRGRGWDAAAAADRDREADPGRGRARRRQRRRRGGPAPRAPARSTGSRSWRPSSAPTCPRSSTPALALVSGRRRAGRAAAAAGASTPSSCSRAAGASPPPRSSPRPTGSGSAATAPSSRHRAGGCARPPASGASPLDYSELLVNDLEPAARSLRPEIGEALDALSRPGRRRALRDRLGPDRVRPLRRHRRRRPGRRGAAAALRRTRSSRGPGQLADDVGDGMLRDRRVRWPLIAAAIVAALLPAQARAARRRPPEPARGRLRHARRLDLPAGRRSSPSPRPAPSSASSSPARR